MRIETATHAKTQFGRILDEAAREPIVIQKSGRNVAVIIPFQEYEHLVALEDSYWVQKADEAKQEGFVGTEEGEKLLNELLNAKD